MSIGIDPLKRSSVDYSCVKHKESIWQLMEVNSKIMILIIIKHQRENKKIKCFSLYFQGKCQRQETSGAWKLAQFNKLCQAKFSCPPILNSGDRQSCDGGWELVPDKRIPANVPKIEILCLTF